MEKLTKEETFAYALIKNQLRLAAYSLPYEEQTYTLTIKRSSPHIKLTIDKKPTVHVSIKMAVGLTATSQTRPLEDTADVGNFPKNLLEETAKRLEEEVRSLFEKCRQVGFDVCDAIDKLQKYENEHFDDKKDTLLEEATLDIHIQVNSVR